MNRKEVTMINIDRDLQRYIRSCKRPGESNNACLRRLLKLPKAEHPAIGLRGRPRKSPITKGRATKQ